MTLGRAYLISSIPVRFALVVIGVVGVAGCDEVFDLEHIGSHDAPNDATHDAPNDATVPSCPAAFDGKRYVVVGDMLLKWLAAEAHCRMLDDTPDDGWHSHLAVINQPGELAGLGLTTEDVWVGYTDRKLGNGGAPMPENFLWITAEPTEPPVWATNEPDSMSTPPYCGVTDNSLTLKDSGCDVSDHFFVCECDEYPELSSQIYR